MRRQFLVEQPSFYPFEPSSYPVKVAQSAKLTETPRFRPALCSTLDPDCLDCGRLW